MSVPELSFAVGLLVTLGLKVVCGVFWAFASLWLVLACIEQAPWYALLMWVPLLLVAAFGLGYAAGRERS